MVDSALVQQIVRFAFVIRLASLLFVVLDPAGVATSAVGFAAVVFITISSALGLYATPRVTTLVQAHPIVLIIDVLVASLIAATIGSQSPLVLYSMSTAVLIGILLPRRYVVLVLTILVCSYVLSTVSQVVEPTVMGIVMIPAAYVTICVLGSLTRTLHSAAMAEQARARRLSETAASERERARLAREMHDSVAKSLHGISLAAAALPAWAEQRPDELADRARELQLAAESASQDARAILVDLRTDHDNAPLSARLRALAEDLSMGGIRTHLSVGREDRIDPPVRQELVAIVAEALENVRRHSRASAVEIEATDGDDELVVSVRDNGVGFDPGNTPVDHFGLVGMRERAEAIGASYDITSEPGSGTQVTVRLPRTDRGNHD